MFRRSLVALMITVVAVAGFTACTATPKPEEKWASNAPTESGWTQLSASEKKEGCDPVADPKAAIGSIAPASDPIDASGFSRPANVSGVELRGGDEYVVVTIDIAKADWPSFAAQLGFPEGFEQTVATPIGGETVRCLIDLDQVAEEFLQSREERGESLLDIRDMESYFDLYVVER